MPSIGAAERQAVLDVLDSGWLTTGQRVVEFEEAIQRELGVRHAVAVNSATSALHADVDPLTLNSTAETIEQQLRPNTKAIEIVHFGGLLADMEPILDLARRRGIPVLEDAAHALPASRNGRAAGTLAEAGALSFYATKTVTTGEGGMLITNDDRIADRARVMRLHGISRDAWKRYTAAGSWFYEIEDVGFKYNLTDIAAAIGIVQLGRAEEMRWLREGVALKYATALEAADLLDLVELPAAPGVADVHAWHLYPIRLHLDRLAIDRATVIEELKVSGIGTSVHFIPLHLHPYYRKTYDYAAGDLPVATREYEREISLPIYPGLGEDAVERVVGALSAILRPEQVASGV